VPESGDELKTIASAPRRSRRPKQLDAGSFASDVGSFALHLAAEGKAVSTIRNYTEAARWFAGEHLLRETCKTSWEQVDTDDVRRWIVHLLGSYSDVYANGQYRGLQQFFKWLAAEDDLPDPMERLRGPKVAEKMVPVFTSVELSQLAKAAGEARSPTAVTPRSSRCSARPACGCPRSPASATASRARPARRALLRLLPGPHPRPARRGHNPGHPPGTGRGHRRLRDLARSRLAPA
jgi:integrase